jgi:hypothetical protein
MHKILNYYEIKRFTLQKIQLMNKYCEILSPLTDTLDFLKGEESMYMGFLLPSLYALEKRLIWFPLGML